MQKDWREIELPPFVVDLVDTVWEVAKFKSLTVLVKAGTSNEPINDRCRVFKTTQAEPRPPRYRGDGNRR